MPLQASSAKACILSNSPVLEIAASIQEASAVSIRGSAFKAQCRRKPDCYQSQELEKTCSAGVSARESCMRVRTDG